MLLKKLIIAVTLLPLQSPPKYTVHTYFLPSPPPVKRGALHAKSKKISIKIRCYIHTAANITYKMLLAEGRYTFILDLPHFNSSSLLCKQSNYRTSLVICAPTVYDYESYA